LKIGLDQLKREREETIGEVKCSIYEADGGLKNT